MGRIVATISFVFWVPLYDVDTVYSPWNRITLCSAAAPIFPQ